MCSLNNISCCNGRSVMIRPLSCTELRSLSVSRRVEAYVSQNVIEGSKPISNRFRSLHFDTSTGSVCGCY